MLSTMRRRGPDAQGIYRQGDCTLMHTRLAVIDPERGRQPMVINWGGERYVLIYNGELYNTQQLRKQLENMGHIFLTHSDSEVVVHAYAQFGADCVREMNGIFALLFKRRAFLWLDCYNHFT